MKWQVKKNDNEFRNCRMNIDVIFKSLRIVVNREAGKLKRIPKAEKARKQTHRIVTSSKFSNTTVRPNRQSSGTLKFIRSWHKGCKIMRTIAMTIFIEKMDRNIDNWKNIGFICFFFVPFALQGFYCILYCFISPSIRRQETIAAR